MILSRFQAGRLLKTLASAESARRFVVVSSHWSVKHGLDVAIGTGKAESADLTVVEIDGEEWEEMPPKRLADTLRKALRVPGWRADQSKSWIRTLTRRFRKKSLVLFFPSSLTLTEDCRRLFQSLLASYEQFHLTFVFDMVWKDFLVVHKLGGRRADTNRRVSSLVKSLGQMLMNARRWAAARRVYDFPNPLLARISDPVQRGIICLNLGILEHKQFHSIRRALFLFQKSRAALRKANPNNPLLRVVHNHLGEIYISLGKYEEAENSFKTGLEYAQEVQDDFSMSITYSSLGRIYTRLHRPVEAEDAFWTAMMHMTRSNKYDGVHHILIGIAQLYIRQNRLADALRIAEEAYAISCMLKFSDAIGLSQLSRAWIYWRLGRIPEARDVLDNAVRIFTLIKQNYPLALAHHYYLRFATHIGDQVLADSHHRAGIKLVDDNRFQDMRALFDRANIAKWVRVEQSAGSASLTPQVPASPMPAGPVSRTPEAAHPARRGVEPMEVRFWGTRGSIPSASPRHIKYGGNTSCVSVRIGKKLIIFDAGTGIRFLGNEILGSPGLDADIPIFISHTHWDHIQGFPFFLPAYSPKYHLRVYGPESFNHSISDLFAMQMRYAFFPVRLGAMKSRIDFLRTRMGTIAAPNLPCAVTAFVLNHPVLVYGYRIDWQGRSLVYATDVEWLRKNRPPLPAGGRPAQMKVYQRLVDVVNRNLEPCFNQADVLIFDAMYTDAEIKTKTGWGHSTLTDAVDLAARAKIKKVFLFHHDPVHDDRQVDAMEREIRAMARRRGLSVDIRAAREGSVVRI